MPKDGRDYASRTAGYGRGFASNSDIFANRGDPWVSDLDRLLDFPLDGQDNPDMDRYFCELAQKASREGMGRRIDPGLIEQQKQARLAKEAKKVRDAKEALQRRALNIQRKMRGKIK